jgi:hypothetical protein
MRYLCAKHKVTDIIGGGGTVLLKSVTVNMAQWVVG